MSREHKFLISMTVLDHLGRQLYRNFITVIGEAISNAWDADAQNVWIELNREQRTLSIIDDGYGMSAEDLDEKFLKIGYTKRGRKGTEIHSRSGRPYIGAKGIGKLALLSCADEISIVSKTKTTEPTGCRISNRELDDAINNDRSTDEVLLEDAGQHAYQLLEDLKAPSGTVLILSGMHTTNNTDEFLRSSIAQGFRFSLIDPSFHIHYNNNEITLKDLSKLTSKTQFAWVFPGTNDEFISQLQEAINNCHNITREKEYTLPPTTLKIEPTERKKDASSKEIHVTGFIASTKKPRDLHIYGSDERATLDLFVNGRIRERNILQHIPSSRVPEQYIYGQIHVNGLDREGTDPFTSAREQVIATDPIYRALLTELKSIFNRIYDDWDNLRLALKEEDAGYQTRDDYPEHIQRILYANPDSQSTNGKTPPQTTVIQPPPTHPRWKDTVEINRTKEARQGYQDRTAVRHTFSDLDYLMLSDLLRFSDKSRSNGLSLKVLAPNSTSEIDKLILLRNIVMHCCTLTQHGRSEFIRLYEQLSEEMIDFATDQSRP